MSPIAEAVIVLVRVFASGVLGLSLRSVLPQQHLKEDSLTMVRLCTGVIATLTALVLGLLVASAKANYDRASNQITSAAAAVVQLDRTLAQYGAQTAEVRSLLRVAVESSMNTLFSAQAPTPAVFLVVLVLWLCIMSAGFGLVTARNPTVLVTLFLVLCQLRARS
jgi:hypothetical protein